MLELHYMQIKVLDKKKHYIHSCQYLQYLIHLVNEMESRFSFEDLNYFPPLENGHINLLKFLKASSDLLSIVDCLGKLLKPVKQDMQGNIEKIKNNFVLDERSCLLDLMLKETAAGGNIGSEATLWLNRLYVSSLLHFLKSYHLWV
ncbi:uncharacterized protein LOC125052924 isoform X3 [Pieris napi]|uniref:uncharacterized protein LOC125052924 isoform X3 n=1 Tax=Pieris napi TaxID=78633 RepID=UPI001FBA727F|nr:uncharacterized protein LOC125052924 isoform X3 [Pieris napi]